MNERYLITSRTPSAFYDPESSCWRTSQASLLSAVPESLDRLPDWGTTSDGELFELRTPERLTDAQDGSASPGLPTPVVNDMGAGKTVEEWDTWTDEIKAKHGNGHGPSLSIEAARLLPTPTARDFRDRGPHAGFTTREKCQSAVDRGFAHLPRVAALLPTPTSVESKVFGPNVDWELRLSNHAIHIASVLMVKPWLDGNEPLDGPHLTQLTIEDCDPDLSSG